MKVLSIYDAFFSGGSRVIHSNIVAGLSNVGVGDHTVLSLSDSITRENTKQFIEDTTSYDLLTTNYVPVNSLHRENHTGFTQEDTQTIQNLIDSSDVVLFLKEQSLAETLASGAKITRPALVCVHRSDPENQGPGLLDAITEGIISGVIACGDGIKEIYEDFGVPEDKVFSIPNGIDTYRFHPDIAHRDNMRSLFGVHGNEPVILQVARFDKMKNIPLFAKAAQEFIDLRPNAHFVLCGAGMNAGNSEFDEVFSGLPEDRVHAMGIISYMELIYPAADLVVLSSDFGEAAPLCLLEAIASGVVPVGTDVGDTKSIVKSKELLAPLNPAGMAKTWDEALKNKERHLSSFSREEVSMDRMIKSYGNLLKAVTNG